MSDRLPPRPKRYGWWRIYNGFFDHPKWKVVASHAQVHVTVVHSVVGKLLECANKARPTGSVERFSIPECAASLDLSEGIIERVYGTLDGLGWIDQGFIPEWYDRQPDDPTAAERMARARAKRDAERDAKRDARDRHAERQRRYRLRKKANGLAGAERVTGDVTLKS